MPVILGPDGRGLLERVTLAMTIDQVRWFLEADAFLRHVSQLWTLKLKLVCLRCWRQGLADTIHVTFNESHQAYQAVCECAKVPGRLPRAMIQQMATDEC